MILVTEFVIKFCLLFALLGLIKIITTVN